MGHLINPTSTRLGIVRLWNSTWTTFSNNLKYTYLLNNDFYLFSIIRVIISFNSEFFPETLSDIMLSHLYIIRNTAKVFIVCFWYDPLNLFASEDMDDFMRQFKFSVFENSIRYVLKRLRKKRIWGLKNRRLEYQLSKAGITTKLVYKLEDSKGSTYYKKKLNKFLKLYNNNCYANINQKHYLLKKINSFIKKKFKLNRKFAKKYKKNLLRSARFKNILFKRYKIIKDFGIFSNYDFYNDFFFNYNDFCIGSNINQYVYKKNINSFLSNFSYVKILKKKEELSLLFKLLFTEQENELDYSIFFYKTALSWNKSKLNQNLKQKKELCSQLKRSIKYFNSKYYLISNYVLKKKQFKKFKYFKSQKIYISFFLFYLFQIKPKKLFLTFEQRNKYSYYWELFSDDDIAKNVISKKNYKLKDWRTHNWWFAKYDRDNYIRWKKQRRRNRKPRFLFKYVTIEPHVIETIDALDNARNQETFFELALDLSLSKWAKRASKLLLKKSVTSKFLNIQNRNSVLFKMNDLDTYLALRNPRASNVVSEFQTAWFKFRTKDNDIKLFLFSFFFNLYKHYSFILKNKNKSFMFFNLKSSLVNFECLSLYSFIWNVALKKIDLLPYYLTNMYFEFHDSICNLLADDTWSKIKLCKYFIKLDNSIFNKTKFVSEETNMFSNIFISTYPSIFKLKRKQ